MAEGSPITLPSGHRAALFEVLKAPPTAPDAWVFRFLVPDLPHEPDYEALAPDLEALCRDVALAQIPESVARVVIALSDRPGAYGAPDPQAAQIFEAYAVASGRCEWEPF